jgi:hypothetical protein
LLAYSHAIVFVFFSGNFGVEFGHKLAANTIQFQTTSLNNFGRFLPIGSGHRHIAKPNHAVVVGDIYILIRLVHSPNRHHALAGFGGRTNGITLVGAENMGIHLS